MEARRLTIYIIDTISKKRIATKKSLIMIKCKKEFKN